MNPPRSVDIKGWELLNESGGSRMCVLEAQGLDEGHNARDDGLMHPTWTLELAPLSHTCTSWSASHSGREKALIYSIRVDTMAFPRQAPVMEELKCIGLRCVLSFQLFA